MIDNNCHLTTQRPSVTAEVLQLYYSEDWNIYWERIAVSLSAQRMRVSNACNTEFRFLVKLGDEPIRPPVRLCLQVKTFGFIIKGFVL